MRWFKTFTSHLLSSLTNHTKHELPFDNNTNISTYPQTVLRATLKLIFSLQLFLPPKHKKELITLIAWQICDPRRNRQCSKSIFFALIIMVINISDLFALQLLLFLELHNCQLLLQLIYKLKKKYSIKSESSLTLPF